MPLKARQVVEPSALDRLLRDVERCSVLHRKGLRRSPEDDEPEAREAEAFVERVTPRALEAKG